MISTKPDNARPGVVVELRDTAADLRATIPQPIARALGLPGALAVVEHDVAGCTDPRCGACAALLCTEDDHRHLQQSGCPWSRCSPLSATSRALVASRADGPVAPPPPPPEVPSIVGLALVSVSILLRGIVAGGHRGIDPILDVVEQAVDALGLRLGLGVDTTDAVRLVRLARLARPRSIEE